MPSSSKYGYYKLFLASVSPLFWHPKQIIANIQIHTYVKMSVEVPLFQIMNILTWITVWGICSCGVHGCTYEILSNFITQNTEDMNKFTLD